MSLTKYIKDTLIIIVVAAIALEFLSFVLSKTKMLPFHQTPLLYLSHGGTGLEWRTENSPWGAWHKKNYMDRHSTQCFNVEYNTNEIGARDEPFNGKMPYKRSYVLLGDSFAEGYGVSREETSERSIENKLGVNVLNFGAGGSLGPLQYFLLYDNLASQYPHEGVIIYFLPDNDFNDNDYAFWQENGLDKFANQTVRYRPYYQKIGKGEYSYFYPDKSEPTEYFDRPRSSFHAFVVNNLWTANTIRTARMVFSKKKTNPFGARSDGRPYSGYFDTTREEQEASLYFVNKLIERIGNKNILLVIIPTESDFSRIAGGDKPAAQYWHQQLKRLPEGRTNIGVVDLADHTPSDIKSLYLSCDGHWSALGSKWAADIVANYLSQRFR